jgi:hypothetical protein
MSAQPAPRPPIQGGAAAHASRYFLHGDQVSSYRPGGPCGRQAREGTARSRQDDPGRPGPEGEALRQVPQPGRERPSQPFDWRGRTPLRCPEPAPPCVLRPRSSGRTRGRSRSDLRAREFTTASRPQASAPCAARALRRVGLAATAASLVKLGVDFVV